MKNYLPVPSCDSSRYWVAVLSIPSLSVSPSVCEHSKSTIYWLGWLRAYKQKRTNKLPAAFYFPPMSAVMVMLSVPSVRSSVCEHSQSTIYWSGWLGAYRQKRANKLPPGCKTYCSPREICRTCLAYFCWCPAEGYDIVRHFVQQGSIQGECLAWETRTWENVRQEIKMPGRALKAYAPRTYCLADLK